MKRIIILLTTVCLLGCKSGIGPEQIDNGNDSTGSYGIVEAFPSLPEIGNPVELTAPNDGSNRVFVVAAGGVIHAFANAPDVSSKTIFLDISSKVASGGEMGLLGLAFSPDYKTNGYFYVNYTRRNPGLETVIARYKVSAGNPNQADASSETILMTFAQPYSNHNGGKLAFGNDNFLYIGTGDGGSGGDPQNNGQNQTTLLGKILRIDVNSAAGGKPYGIPADNPFKGNTAGLREEIFAYGLRNPWRFSIDPATRLLWVADVGQDKTEEIDIVELGGNYGWNLMEGNDCYTSNCNREGLALPIYTYAHGSAGSSITGGYIVRDKALPGLLGKYVYGDFVSGNIWALTHANKKAVQNDLIGKVSGGSLSSFGEDSEGNLYILNFTDGRVYKIIPAR